MDSKEKAMLQPLFNIYYPPGLASELQVPVNRWLENLPHSTSADPYKRRHKCLLPSCNVMTAHNGGYCCAEHCREHKGVNK